MKFVVPAAQADLGFLRLILESLSPDQASRLLRRLVADERLVMKGSRRWARYRLPEAEG